MMRAIILMTLVPIQLLAGSGHLFKFTIKGVSDTVVYMAGYYGAKQYFRDTTTIDKNGVAVFKGEKPLPCGIYSVVLPDKHTYFEFILNEQNFEMATDTSDLIMNMKVRGSVENKAFYDYLKFINADQARAVELRKVLENADASKEEKGKAKKEMAAINKTVTAYKEKFINDHIDLLVAQIFLSSKDPEVPETEHQLPNGVRDSLFAYRYYRHHYFDNMKIDNECLLRSPVYHNKLQYYITKLIPQIPDSINAAADELVEQARNDKETFKYVVHWITNHYEQSKIMGMDAVFVHMAEKYYLTGEAWWMDSTHMAKVEERAKILGPILIGKKCPNLVLQDTMGTWQVLHNIHSKYTVLFIWDPDCGHCKKEIPKLKKAYEEYLKDHGVTIYAASTDFENKKWRKFLRENDMPFINVSDSPEYPNKFRDVFDVYATPQVLVLDSNKVIIAKKLNSEQLEAFIKHEEKTGK